MVTQKVEEINSARTMSKKQSIIQEDRHDHVVYDKTHEARRKPGFSVVEFLIRNDKNNIAKKESTTIWLMIDDTRAAVRAHLQ